MYNKNIYEIDQEVNVWVSSENPNFCFLEKPSVYSVLGKTFIPIVIAFFIINTPLLFVLRGYLHK